SPRLLFKTSYRSPLLFYNYSSTTNIYTLSLHDALPIYLTFESYMTLKLDRILDWKVSTEKKPQISYGEKFRDGEVRNKRVDPFMGRELTIRVQFAYDPTIVTDQFPTARIIEHTPDGAVIEFISQETPGLKRWLLS